jgi:GNAT superfamily N-acetyltransferase
MDEEYKIVYSEKPEWGVIGGGISDYNEQEGGESHSQLLCYVLQAPDEEVVGGVIGETHWDWLYVNLMWIRGDLRGQGYGQRLLELAENEARKRGAKHAYLDTFSFQAPEFYKKSGYQVFGELEDFPAGHQRYYMAKEL